MGKVLVNQLTRREREVLYAVYELEEATVAEVQEHLEDASYNAIRRLLDNLAKKELISFRKNGRQFVYLPAEPKAQQGAAALREVLDAFFEGSPALGFTSLLRTKDSDRQKSELDSIRELLEKERQEKNS